jgi:hypothetical protein
MATKGIYRFDQDFGRMGGLDGVFVATDEEVLAATGKVARFGEALGKHSDVWCELDADNVKLLTDEPSAVDVVEKYRLGTGYNPLHYLGEDE